MERTLKVLLERLPSSPRRAWALKALEQSLAAAGKESPRVWRLTLPARKAIIRLNVGLLYVLDLASDFFRLTVTDSAASRAAFDHFDLEVVDTFKSPKGLVAVRGSIEVLSSAYATLKEFHEDAIERAAGWQPRVTSAGHEPALVDALRELGSSVPDVSENGIPQAFWVVRGYDKETDWDLDLPAGAESTWYSSKPTHRMEPGDGVVFWRLRPGQEVVGLGEVVQPEEPDADGKHHVRLRSLSGPLKYRLRIDELQSVLELRHASFLKPGIMGTAIALRRPEARALHQLIAVREPQVAARVGWFGAVTARRVEEGSEGTDDLDFSWSDLLDDARPEVAHSIKLRQGQGPFRNLLLAAYDGRCAVTGCAVENALAAAHILPYRGTHSNNVRNGLLLRADVHLLFDSKQLWIEPDGYVVRVAPGLRGSEYEAFDGKPLRNLPLNAEDRPSPEALRLLLGLRLREP